MPKPPASRVLSMPMHPGLAKAISLIRAAIAA
jgi:hypothetical protein